MKKRKVIPVKIRNSIIKRSGGLCEKCKKPIIKENIAKLDKIKIEVWGDHQCWKCNKYGEIIDIKYLNELGIWFVEDNVLGNKINELFPFFHEGYSKTVEGSYFANHCSYCKIIQGDYYLHEWVVEMTCEGQKPERTIALDIPDSSTFHDEIISKERNFHIHHIDENPANNVESNLIVLCPECHRSYHRSRKTEERHQQSKLINYFDKYKNRKKREKRN